MAAYETDNMSNVITTAGAGAAVVSPWWLPSLHEVSTVAAELAPILGAIWLLTQIILKVSEYRRSRNGKG
jgi:hypothetical protein